MFARLFLLSVVVFSTLFSQENTYVAVLKKPLNAVEIHRMDNIIKITKDSEYLQSGDIIQTGSQSKVTIIFNDGTVVNLDAKSILKVNDYIFKPSVKEYKFDLFLKKGVAVFESGKMGKVAPEKISFNVPSGTIAVRGTKFLVEVR